MIDLWYPNERGNINGMDCSFSDCDCIYRGNLYANERPVGDFSARDSRVVKSIANNFNIKFNWK